MSGERAYHHGNVPAAVLAAALEAVAERGVSGLSLRDVARRVGVSHGAAAHHFGDKTGLLTAVAADGYRRLAGALGEAWQRSGSLADVGAAYVAFAVEHPAHFDVMFRPDVHRRDDPEVQRWRDAGGAVLYGAAEQVADAAGGDARRAGLAAWAYAHGLAVLWRSGLVPPGTAADAESLARQLGPLLFQGSAAAGATDQLAERAAAASKPQSAG